MRSVALVVLIMACGAAAPAVAGAQNLGHRIPGTVGLAAGSQPAEGVYVADRLLVLHANRAVDRDGRPLALPGFGLDGLANATGLAGTVQLHHDGPYLSAAVSVPAVSLSVNSNAPAVSVDRFGLGDVFVQPFKLGWRLPRVEVVTSYAFYVPTGWFEPRGQGSLGTGSWVHEFAVGGTVYVDPDRTVFVSALGSYFLNQSKRGLDFTRGDVVQIQGGVGARLFRLVDVGLAGYALWQVGDDRGADVPQALRGSRDSAFGLGPELDVRVPQLNASVGVRYVRDVFVRARPVDELLVFSVTWAAWRPATPRAHPRSAATSRD